MHPALECALAKRGRQWGERNEEVLKIALRELKPHGTPAYRVLQKDKDRRARMKVYGSGSDVFFVTHIKPAE